MTEGPLFPPETSGGPIGANPSFVDLVRRSRPETLPIATGIAPDLNAQQFGDGGGDVWTDVQVSTRRGRSIDELAAEWDREAPVFEVDTMRDVTSFEPMMCPKCNGTMEASVPAAWHLAFLHPEDET